MSIVEPSILKSIKKLLGLDDEYHAFDQDIMLLINTQFSVLHNVGAAPPNGFFTVTGEEELWTDYLKDVPQADMVKTYIYLKVRMLFDPPANAFVMTAFQEQAKELEWRLNTLEFDFNPAARPITSDRESRLLSNLLESVDDLEDKVEELDEENDVPDLTTIYKGNLEVPNGN